MYNMGNGLRLLDRLCLGRVELSPTLDVCHRIVHVCDKLSGLQSDLDGVVGQLSALNAMVCVWRLRQGSVAELHATEPDMAGIRLKRRPNPAVERRDR